VLRAARQAHREHRAFARLARHGHIAAHHARELGRDGKSEPGTAKVLSGRSVSLAELSGHASRIARQRALWRKYQRLRAQSRGPDPIGRQLAIGVTDFEMFLAGLGLPAPSAAPSGDKPRARK
jgi:hypothetical protein